MVFKMTAEDALDEFSKFAVEVFKDVNSNPRKQTDKLTRTIHGILERYGIDKDVKLVPTDRPASTCKLSVVLNSCRANIHVT